MVQGMFFQQLYCIPIVLHLSLEIMRMHFTLSGPLTSLHIRNHIHYTKFAIEFSKNEGGVKGHLEFSLEFIRFDSRTLPFVKIGCSINSPIVRY